MCNNEGLCLDFEENNGDVGFETYDSFFFLVISEIKFLFSLCFFVVVLFNWIPSTLGSMDAEFGS